MSSELNGRLNFSGCVHSVADFVTVNCVDDCVVNSVADCVAD